MEPVPWTPFMRPEDALDAGILVWQPTLEGGFIPGWSTHELWPGIPFPRR